MTAPIRLLIVDDNQDIHDVVKHLVRAADDITIVGQAYDGDGGLALCLQKKPDLVLMDVVLPGMSGAATTTAILDALPEVKVLALSSYHEYEHIKTMLDSGVIGYVVKDGIAQDLIATIRSTMRGNTVLSPPVARTMFTRDAETEPGSAFNLTERELQVLALLAEGLTYSKIASELRISPPTVRFHLNNILDKLQVQTRSEALVIAAKNNLI